MNHNPGIYKITNLANGKIYVGESLYLEHRRNLHFEVLSKGVHSNQSMQHDFFLHGNKSFSFEIVEQLPSLENIDGKTSSLKEKAVLICREKAFISKYNTLEDGYNEEDTFDEILNKRKGLLNGVDWALSSSMLKQCLKNTPDILNADYNMRAEDILFEKAKKMTREEWEAKKSAEWKAKRQNRRAARESI